MTKNTESSKPDPNYPYVAKFPDGYKNTISKDIPCPKVASFYYGRSNANDAHNQDRQDHPALETNWITHATYYNND